MQSFIHFCVLVVSGKEIEGCSVFKEYRDYWKSSAYVLIILYF